MNINKIIPYLFPLAFLLSCEEDAVTTNNFVVEAYLFANEPVTDVAVTEIVPFESSDQAAEPISEAAVSIVRGNEQFALQYHPETSKYRYTGDDLKIEVNEHYRIEVNVGDRAASAETIVPEATQGLAISEEQLVIPKLMLQPGLGQQIEDLLRNTRLTVTWDNPDDQLHFIVIESTSNTQDPILPDNFPSEGGNLLRAFRFISEPTIETSFEILGLSLETYGAHKVKVYRVNQEYADLFENQRQDSRDLNEPPSNIANALGIFSAFASDSIFFDVVREN
ncbi:DUF4249 family protein [Fulvivirgaceae bacterium BMA10]|uniref:DUF4249 family protein n=1 Tax=Splendidivirga corallicola TaxID=3051826 RepID=A0ABT8KXY5_9BACT|nr:DUF4249 family protein [Fulvivirgaceae bacterium BMA10]